MIKLELILPIMIMDLMLWVTALLTSLCTPNLRLYIKSIAIKDEVTEPKGLQVLNQTIISKIQMDTR